MKVFIDESGNFIRGQKSSISCVGALAIPDLEYKRVVRAFAEFKEKLKLNDAEIKGSRLDETQVNHLLTRLTKFDILFYAAVVDCSVHSTEDVIFHRQDQADRLVANLTPEHQPSLVEQVHHMRGQLLKLSPQLYTQYVAQTELMHRSIELFTLYYAQRIPRDLRRFSWTIDAKSPSGLTSGEIWWKTLLGPALQSKAIRNPMKALKGANYAYFDEVFVEDGADRTQGLPISINKLVLNNLVFRNSSEDCGLQLADIFTNATRRAFSGNLKPSGWAQLGKFMIRTARPNPSPVALLHLGSSASDAQIGISHSRVVRTLNAVAKGMLR